MTTEPISGSRRPLSLALRITLLVSIVMAVLLSSYAVLVALSMERHFAEQDLGEIRAVVESLSSALEEARDGDEPQALERRLARAVAGHHGVYFSVSDASGRILFGTASKDLLDVAQSTAPSQQLDAQALTTWPTTERVFRGARLQLHGETMLVAVSMESHLIYLAQVRRGLGWGTAFASLAAVLAAWLAVRWGHAPLRRISSTIRGVTSDHLHVRLAPGDVPIELEPLAASFNEMLDQLQASFLRLTHFSADIAHELRTPVTNLTTQTQVALSKARDPEAYREVPYSGLEEMERLGKMIGDMLYLAQADNRLSTPEMVDIDLTSEVGALFDFFEALAEDQGIKLEVAGSAPMIRGDRLMIRRALSNLISNALRYTPQGDAIRVQLEDHGKCVKVRVLNRGPTIAPAHLANLFDRFYRADPSRQRKGDGAGLGLAIVRSIVEAHGGKVGVESEDGETCFWMTFPVAATVGTQQHLASHVDH